MVPQDAGLRACGSTLSGEGLPSQRRRRGYSLLDDQGMTHARSSSSRPTYQRALEGELAKTIEAIDGVETAVVHLARARGRRLRRRADAAHRLGARADQPGLHADADAGAGDRAPGLVARRSSTADQVTVADAHGTVLLRRRRGCVGAGRRPDTADAATRGRAPADASRRMLDQLVGAGNAVVTVDRRPQLRPDRSTARSTSRPSRHPAAADSSPRRSTRAPAPAASAASSARTTSPSPSGTAAAATTTTQASPTTATTPSTR